MTALVAKLTGAACTFLVAIALVAAGAVLFVTVMMPFVFPLFLVSAGLVTRRLSRRAAAPRVTMDLPAANAPAVATGAETGIAV